VVFLGDFCHHLNASFDGGNTTPEGFLVEMPMTFFSTMLDKLRSVKERAHSPNQSVQAGIAPITIVVATTNSFCPRGSAILL
jgi:hypothetical protein